MLIYGNTPEQQRKSLHESQFFEDDALDALDDVASAAWMWTAKELEDVFDNGRLRLDRLLSKLKDTDTLPHENVVGEAGTPFDITEHVEKEQRKQSVQYWIDNDLDDLTQKLCEVASSASGPGSPEFKRELSWSANCMNKYEEFRASMSEAGAGRAASTVGKPEDLIEQALTKGFEALGAKVASQRDSAAMKDVVREMLKQLLKQVRPAHARAVSRPLVLSATRPVAHSVRSTLSLSLSLFATVSRLARARARSLSLPNAAALGAALVHLLMLHQGGHDSPRPLGVARSEVFFFAARFSFHTCRAPRP